MSNPTKGCPFLECESSIIFWQDLYLCSNPAHKPTAVTVYHPVDILLEGYREATHIKSFLPTRTELVYYSQR